MNKVSVKIMHTRYTWDDKIYRSFIIQLLKELEPRKELIDTMLMSENHNCYEVIFFEQGTYYIGYCLNNEIYWELKQSLVNMLFAYECSFRLRCKWTYKTKTQCLGYSMRTAAWH